MTQIPLYTMLETLVSYLNAFRTNENDQPGQAVGEEKGATFGKVTGIEEVIAKHAANVTLLKSQTERLFNSDIADDRNPRESSYVKSGDVVVISSLLYGKEVYGIDIQSEDGQRISSQSPMAKLLLGKEIGNSFDLSGTKYSILEIHVPGESEILKRLEFLKRQITSETEKILLTNNKSESAIGRSEEKLERKLKISNFLDQISFVALVEKTYALEPIFSTTLTRQKELLKQEEHFPVTDLESTSGFIHIMGKLNRKS